MEHVDVTGEICPRPALIVRDHLATLDSDDVLCVRGDYPPAEANLRRTCTKHGYEVEVRSSVDDGDGFELLVRPGADREDDDGR